jgi:hypothetical protein
MRDEQTSSSIAWMKIKYLTFKSFNEYSSLISVEGGGRKMMKNYFYIVKINQIHELIIDQFSVIR